VNSYPRNSVTHLALADTLNGRGSKIDNHWAADRVQIEEAPLSCAVEIEGNYLDDLDAKKDGVTQPSAPPPDWYQNQNGELQWWDGEKWGPVAPPAASSQRTSLSNPQNAEDRSPATETIDTSSLQHYRAEHPPTPPERKESNPLGIWSVLLGTLSIILLLAFGTPTPIAAIVGVIGVILAALGLGSSKGLHLERSKASPSWGMALSAITLIGSALIAFAPPPSFSGLTGADSTKSTESSAAEPQASTPPPEPQPSAEEQRDAHMIEQGFSVWDSGETWLKAVDPANYTCDYGVRCIWYQLVSYSGCSAGFYVKADLLSASEMGIGWTNEITASVPPTEGVAFQLMSMQSGIETVRVSEVTCMG